MLIVGDSVSVIWVFDNAYVLGVGDAKSGYEQTLIIKGFSTNGSCFMVNFEASSISY